MICPQDLWVLLLLLVENHILVHQDIQGVFEISQQKLALGRWLVSGVASLRWLVLHEPWETWWVRELQLLCLLCKIDVSNPALGIFYPVLLSAA